MLIDHPVQRGADKKINMDKLADRDAVTIFGKLCATQVEMADFFGVCITTIETYMAAKNEEFYLIYSRGMAEAKTSLRRVQLNKAMTGDTSMCIWLGKQLLDQKDRVEKGYDEKTLDALSKEDRDLLNRVGVKVD